MLVTQFLGLPLLAYNFNFSLVIILLLYVVDIAAFVFLYICGLMQILNLSMSRPLNLKLYWRNIDSVHAIVVPSFTSLYMKWLWLSVGAEWCTYNSSTFSLIYLCFHSVQLVDQLTFTEQATDLPACIQLSTYKSSSH